MRPPVTASLTISPPTEKKLPNDPLSTQQELLVRCFVFLYYIDNTLKVFDKIKLDFAKLKMALEFCRVEIPVFKKPVLTRFDSDLDLDLDSSKSGSVALMLRSFSEQTAEDSEDDPFLDFEEPSRVFVKNFDAVSLEGTHLAMQAEADVSPQEMASYYKRNSRIKPV